MAFKDYIAKGDAKEVSKDIGAARAMFEKANMRLQYVRSIAIDEKSATFVFEDVYEVIRECAHGIMFADGFRPTDSHEACVAFINDRYGPIYGDMLVNEFDRYRKTRNDSKYRLYYVDKDMTEEALKNAIEFVRITELVLNPKLR